MRDYFKSIRALGWGIVKRFYILIFAVLDPLDIWNRLMVPYGYPTVELEPLGSWILSGFIVLVVITLAYHEVRQTAGVSSPKEKHARDALIDLAKDEMDALKNSINSLLNYVGTANIIYHVSTGGPVVSQGEVGRFYNRYIALTPAFDAFKNEEKLELLSQIEMERLIIDAQGAILNSASTILNDRSNWSVPIDNEAALEKHMAAVGKAGDVYRQKLDRMCIEHSFHVFKSLGVEGHTLSSGAFSNA